ncbi:peptidoglycan-binding protein [Rhizobium sp. CFBP 8762]|uniref:peptidoglycan-binding domain-containing protein n=1 Tax=Rhizobium sp. CFBP 8762 TaxID=2775279 RepID=UPI001781D18A|nr:peptidoglycan-binding domain-containing protein [Rhizobium sp. CFBP 8762]MBD8553193.1 peptidoglycan-binding protein [Rhizobium sp. CFBP 8762]
MTARTRKSPKSKKPAPKKSGILARGLKTGLSTVVGAIVRTASRYPVAIAGGTAFAVVYSFVATNAIWYQHGTHPSPFFRTRDPLVTERNVTAEPKKVTTFVIQREGEGEDAGVDRDVATGTVAADEIAASSADDAPALPSTSSSMDAPVAVVTPTARPYELASRAAKPQADADPVAAAIRDADKPAGPNTALQAQTKLVVTIQRGLSNIAYDGVTVDGVAGEQTRTAIRRFEKHYKLPETGQPNENVLKKLKEIGAL